ncbi:MAG: RNA-directed DNA polymerase [Hafnia sp.]
MPIINKKYQELQLTDEYITDPLLMALAWKKSHHYIRTTNWYADNFELDLSALDLMQHCKDWVKRIQNKKEFKLEELQLVPVPKACKWEFKTVKNKVLWLPCDEKELTLRPLAHIPIAEQTIMTLVMMCLANTIETKQGNPDTSYDIVHQKGIVNYGNRLYCQYIDDKAEHSFGATVTYSKYFTDYRKFLNRPYHFASKAQGEISPDESVYIIELDLAKFFDLVNRKTLINKIKSHVNGAITKKENPLIDHLFKSFTNWDWTAPSIKNYDLCKSDEVKEIPKGIPQGLVAAGFLSNIYLLELDQFLNNKINTDITDDIKFVDYCRYVDDMRFVVKVKKSKNNNTESINNVITNLLKNEIDNIGLIINPKKTKIEIFRGKTAGLSRSLENIQTRLSGPISMENANEQLGHLESLLSLTKTDFEPPKNGTSNRLAEIEKDRFDVREDTLKRFSANKISKILKELRHFTSQDIDTDGEVIAGEWDYLQERLARRFIVCWSHDPSLVLLLKKGLELFPNPKLLDPILEQLCYLIESDNEKQSAVAAYCLAEIFRHSAMTIHKKDVYAFPAQANVDGYFEKLQHCAATLMNKRSASDNKTWNLLINQASFLLLVRLDNTLEKSGTDARYDLILKLASGFRTITLPTKMDSKTIASCILLANQLVKDNKSFIRSCASLCESIYDKKHFVKLNKIVNIISHQNSSLFKSLVYHSRPLQQSWLSSNSVIKAIHKCHIDTQPLAIPLNKITGSHSLLRVILRPDNPFSNEIMALKLMHSLLLSNIVCSDNKKNHQINLANTKVTFDNYSIPPTSSVFDSKMDVNTELFQSSGWGDSIFTDDADTHILYRVAMCIRSVLLGKQDWTDFGQEISPKQGYRGIKTSRDKRQLGMMTTPETIGGENSQVSGWLTTLLSKLLAWPGISVGDNGYQWPAIFTVDVVRKLVDARLRKLKQDYCKLSGTPGLTEKVQINWPESKKSLTVAMVQSKLPATKDFVSHGLLLNAAKYRAIHRKHVAEVADLVVKHTFAQRTIQPSASEKIENIDLIVWPELAVHKDDLDVLIALSRKTNAIIYSGLTFIEQPGIKGPNNCAVWIVPPKSNSTQNEMIRLQGKHNMMADEKGHVEPWRPYQLMLELVHPQFPDKKGFVLTGSICYDATDIALSADLRDKSNAYLVAALNRDVNTFDSMVEALHYHMYQHVVLVNSGEFGGSYAKAPYKEPFNRLIAHVHGNDQVAISTFEMNMFDFRRDNVGKSMQSGLDKKTAPAGITM